MDQKSGEDQKQKQFSKSCVWDCGSTLYDSYELTSFKRQLDSAIANSPRTFSMPHLSRNQQPPHPPPPPPSSNKPFKISRTFHKLLRFVFKSSSGSNKFRICSSSNHFQQVAAADNKYSNSRDRLYVVYDKSEAVLTTIPELPEFEIAGISPNISSLVTKSASERFTTTSIGISCA